MAKGGSKGVGRGSSPSSKANLKNNIKLKINDFIKKSKDNALKISDGNISSYERFVYKDQEANNIRDEKTPEELKKQVGSFIETKFIYEKDNVPMPNEIKYHLQDLGREKTNNLINRTKTEKIDIKDINIIQKFVFEKPLNSAIEKNNSKVVLFKYKGKYYLNDGNHRVAALHLKGIKSVDAVIENIDD